MRKSYGFCSQFDSKLRDGNEIELHQMVHCMNMPIWHRSYTSVAFMFVYIMSTQIH